MNILEQITGQLAGGNLDALSKQLGVDPGIANQAIAAALPMIVGAMAKNASTPQGAEALDNALAKDHDGSILGQLGGFLGSSDNGAGAGILGHVFSGNLGNVVNTVSQMSGMDASKTGSLLENLAPIVMGTLGQQKRQQNMGSDGIAGMLINAVTQTQGGQNSTMSGAIGMLNSMFDQDGDGSALNDIGGMLGRFMKK